MQDQHTRPDLLHIWRTRREQPLLDQVAQCIQVCARITRAHTALLFVREKGPDCLFRLIATLPSQASTLIRVVVPQRDLEGMVASEELRSRVARLLSPSTDAPMLVLPLCDSEETIPIGVLLLSSEAEWMFSLQEVSLLLDVLCQHVSVLLRQWQTIPADSPFTDLFSGASLDSEKLRLTWPQYVAVLQAPPEAVTRLLHSFETRFAEESVISGIYQGDMVVVLPASIKGVFEQYIQECTFQEASLLGGISLPCYTAKELARAYGEARETVIKGTRLGWSQTGLLEYPEIAGIGFIGDLEEETAPAGPFEGLLQALERVATYAPERGPAPELIQTLEHFIKYRGSKSLPQIAEELGIHRNTLLDRLETVKALTGLDVRANSAHQFSIEVALTLRALRQAKRK